MEQNVSFYVYIVASRRNGTLYIGMTDDLVRRVWMHREGILPGFTKRYGVKTLVWYEHRHSVKDAIGPVSGARHLKMKPYRCMTSMVRVSCGS